MILRDGQKCATVGQKTVEVFFGHFCDVKKPIKRLCKPVRTQKKHIAKNHFSSWSYNSFQFSQIRLFGRIWPELQAPVAPRGKNIFATWFLGADQFAHRFNRPFDKWPKKKLFDPGTFLAASQNPLMGRF